MVATPTDGSDDSAYGGRVTYREWVGPPPTWWVLSVLYSLSWLLATGFYLGPLAGVLALGVAQAVVTTLLLAMSTRLRLVGSELHVGRAVLDLGYVSAVEGLDAEATARRTGPDADARAHLVLQPHTKTAVELTLDDPVDPVPYWVISTRRPARLADAVDAVRTAGSSRLTP
jgi:Protein of unknown function (DUF3093)